MTSKLKTTASLFMTAFMVVILTITMNAQPQGQRQGPPPAPSDEEIETMVDEIAEELALTNDQKTQVEAKYKAHFEEVSTLMKNGRPERSKMEKLNSSFEKEVKALLTKEQKKKYETYLKKNERQPRR